MAPLRDLLTWTSRLTGLDPSRVERSIEVIESWGISTLTDRLDRPRTVDDAVRAVLLAEAVEHLAQRGTPMTKLLSKLRDHGQFESVWAELRCAAVLAGHTDSDVRVELERGKSSGAHPDVTLVFPEGPEFGSVEVKAVGLSDSEVAFCNRMAPALDAVIPAFGMVTLHAPLDGQPPKWTPELAAHARLDAARGAATVPNYPAGMAAATIVAHGTEASYTRRAVSRVYEAVRQLPEDHECWVALYWTNGAPTRTILAAVDWEKLPAHIQGLIFVASVVAFPHRDIDVFTAIAGRGAGADGDWEMESTISEEFGHAVLERTEASAGVRATLIRGPIRGKRRQILRRDGSERLPPFNLVLDRDPEEFAASSGRPTRGPGTE